MALISALAVAGTLISAGGLAMQYKAGQEQRKQGRLAAEAEAKRQQQMNLEATRQKRQTIRQAQIQRAQAESTANSQGSSETSGLAGALGTIGSSADATNLATSQNQEIGNQLFAINAQRAQAQANASMYSSMSGGLSTFGNALVKNAGTIDKFGTYLTS